MPKSQVQTTLQAKMTVLDMLALNRARLTEELKAVPNGAHVVLWTKNPLRVSAGHIALTGTKLWYGTPTYAHKIAKEFKSRLVGTTFESEPIVSYPAPEALKIVEAHFDEMVETINA